jgi:hypothetical protein
LRAAHLAGLVHGHLQAESLVLTADGTVKLCGLGEPPWLAAELAGARSEPGVLEDLASLGQIAAGWAALAAERKSSAKRIDELSPILKRLTAPAERDRYLEAHALFEDLERSIANLPADVDSWERLLGFVRNRGIEEGDLRESA